MKKIFYKNHLIKKKLGQTFLKDQNIINTIINHIQLKKQQITVEIGPGLGALTKEIIKLVDQLTVIEIDQNLSQRLIKNLSIKKINVIQKNVTTINFKELSNHIGQPIRIIGNLPYNIATKIIFHLLQYSDIIQDMYLMLQTEIAKRLMAAPNNKNYGKLSVVSQYYCSITGVLEVQSHAFVPKPQVNSRMVKLVPYHTNNNPYPKTDIQKLNTVTRIAFNQRRKTIKNSLSSIFEPQELKNQGINLQSRAENLNIEQFCNLANATKKCIYQ
ncbi:16S rRNA (adenine(1518)-N(6)/adenine(1519)-N(6))-dimethyltransferase RsmA [Blochmannia endosymbiont of Polyrhachis (Hedomyrma) turneri]|uniref:16S rRNA (adenine(1518)-N(6)/adenine(1519)-N(6))- dimethyltransferase RsmA n=1 Tax=Blochmannia endosymbiont of Polyrhachis (Hedomyrma) turneri TaxID=1505596 RepID=UPI00061A57CD|nr:16S rRNA (adenine(1518)-N(6)/adenine(1519)-N(6))-dimethyltransferase RsmA [Blochmannia endosymbiont of Polyrhachis (Hedomyrma) turneri]AKC59709.1 Ribosomal RNA small subunit methyltransferase A [Blochmannia endosymbiont of Polyrhachis (Hedomyrma) turneri]